MSVYRIYVEKKAPFAVEADSVLADVRTSLRIEGIESLRLFNRYDVEGVSEDVFQKAQPTVFSEPSVDNVFFTLPERGEDETVFAIEYLPGQFDQRADSWRAVYPAARTG